MRVKSLKAVRDKFALELLYHGGLAAERLGLEGEEFYEGIRWLYGSASPPTLPAAAPPSTSAFKKTTDRIKFSFFTLKAP